MSAAATLLAQYNVSVTQAREFLLANLQSPQIIYSNAKQFGLTNQMLAEIYGDVAAADVRVFFTSLGFDAAALDPVPVTEPILPAQYSALGAQLFSFNTFAGNLSTDTIKQAIINTTSPAAYNNAVDFNSIAGSDGLLSVSDLGFAHLGDITNAEQLESLYFGSLIKALKSIDVVEAAEMKAFGTAHAAALAAGDREVVQNFVNLLVTVFEDQAAPELQLIPDDQIAVVLQIVGQAFVQSGAGASGFFDSLTSMIPGFEN